ncbi:hypothetical protein WA026_001585 [Henosepilachna vigintioctopunctata]|uniref:Uncharacterized protein n=1 Tax=Henosepilachna vigintioctopunctata TaxID=420089 RepID=A0AAW1UUB0_9CUCU
MRLYAKKKIPSPWNVNPTDPWSVFRSIRSSESPRSQVTGPTRESILESVVSEQKADRAYEVFYSSAVIGSCLIIFLLIAVFVFIKKRRSKHDDKSVIVFPSTQGNTSQFL